MGDAEPDFSSLFARKDQKTTLPKHDNSQVKRYKASKPAGNGPSAGLTAKARKKDPVNIQKQRVTGAKRKAVNPVPDDGPGEAQRVDGEEGRPPPSKKGKRVEEKFWPFQVDYNDHFETSARAIEDIQPILSQLCKRLKKKPAELVIYDPFFCKGGIRRHYETLGFTNFVHRNRDFYKDVASGNLPQYDILVTNPPYSEDHKERILDFCLRSGKPWALLLPNYVATKAYFAQLLDAAATPAQQRPFFLTPRVRYTYDHPEGTGHEESPFFSIWYIGLGQHTEAVFGACRTRLDAAAATAAAGGGSGGKGASPKGSGGGGGGKGQGAGWDVSLARSVDALRQAKAVPTAKRLNPKQRMRLKKRQGA